MENRYNPFVLIILLLTLVVPILVLPMVLDNAFNTPKTTLMLTGVCLMVGIYVCRFLVGQTVPVSRASTPVIFIVLTGLNFFSLFYTGNPYYTLHAMTMNLTCLLLIYFVSLYVGKQASFLVFLTAALSGALVSIETYFQFFNIFLIFKWAHPGIMVMGTIGNSNYLGAYLVFPLFALAGLVFLLKGRLRLIPLFLFVFVMGAFLFTRARAGWFGFFLSLPLFLYFMKRVFQFQPLGHVKPRIIQTAKWFFVCVSLLVGLWYAAPQRLHTMMDFRNVTEAMTLKLRMKKYSASSLWLFKQNPLFGTGLWSYRNMVFEAQAQINKVSPDFFKDYPEPKPESAHNEYLEVFNDGGIVGAALILLFLATLFKHAWQVISNDGLDIEDRVMMGTATSAVVAILLAAFFFFPFRINSTFFMTALMMGLVEGIYLRSTSRLSTQRIELSPARYALIPLLCLLLAGAVWFKGIKPIMAEAEHFRYKKALAAGNADDAEKFILKAISWDPHNTTYNFLASQVYMSMKGDLRRASDFIERAILDYNGDIIRWTLFYLKGVLKYQAGSVLEARNAFEKALYYNPTFQEAQQKLDEIQKVIQDHDKVLIKFR